MKLYLITFIYLVKTNKTIIFVKPIYQKRMYLIWYIYVVHF